MYVCLFKPLYICTTILVVILEIKMKTFIFFFVSLFKIIILQNRTYNISCIILCFQKWNTHILQNVTLLFPDSNIQVWTLGRDISDLSNLKINFLLGIFPLLAILIFGHNSMNPLRNTFFTLVRWFGDTLTISFYLPTFHSLLKEVWLKVCTANSRPGFHLVFGFPTQVSKS